MYQVYLGLKFAFSYFSVLPISFKASDDLSQRRVLGVMLFSLPLVGLVLGTVTVLLFSLLAQSTWLGAVVSAVLYMVLYGFIHTEAILDVMDAIYAGHSGKDAYEIIKDPTVGAMGVLYTIVAVILKISATVYLFLHDCLMEFIAVLIVSRLSLLLLLKLYTFRSSFVTKLKASLLYHYFISALLLFTLVGYLLTPSFFVLLGIGFWVAYLLSLFMRSKLGFVNGDVLGATLEGVEIVLFLIIALFMISPT